MAGKKDIVEQALKLIASGEPQKTVKAYKLFRQKEGKLYPLFVDANEEVALGQWLKAKAGEQAASGKVKSKLGELAYRPGWHAGDLPIATHIGARSHGDPRLPPDTRPSSQVWAEVEMADDVDWQKVADERARITKKGMPDPKTAHITDQVPYGGYYRYKTNPNMTGNWMIGGDMRVNRILTDDEVKAINDAAGVADLPRREGYGPGGWVDDVVKMAGKVFSPEEKAENLSRFISGSKLLDEAGNPQRLYHITNKNFDVFKPGGEDPTISGPAIWLSPYPEKQPAMHNVGSRSGFKEGTNVMPVYARMKNPLLLDTPEMQDWARTVFANESREFPYLISPEAKKAMQDEGYDGIILGGASGVNDDEVIVFEGDQIKSAIGNIGSYDPADPRIDRETGGRTGFYCNKAYGGRIAKSGGGSFLDDALRMAGKAIFGEGDNAAKAGIRAYHGSPNEISEFKSGMGKTAKDIYLTPFKEDASGYGKNVYEVDVSGKIGNFTPENRGPEQISQLKEAYKGGLDEYFESFDDFLNALDSGDMYQRFGNQHAQNDVVSNLLHDLEGRRRYDAVRIPDARVAVECRKAL